MVLVILKEVKMNSLMFEVLSEADSYDVVGGWNWEFFTYAVAAVGVVGAVVCPPVAVVSGVYEATYWITRAIRS